jgi:hypothetical protein
MSVQCHACVGSTSIAEGTRDGQQILSGTPGRVFGCSCECYNVVRRLDYGSKVHDWPIQILLKRLFVILVVLTQ